MRDNFIPHFAEQLDLFFYSYDLHSIKDFERKRISTQSPIELSCQRHTSLCVYEQGVIKEQSEARSPVTRDIGCFSDQYSKRRGWWNKTWKKMQVWWKCLNFIPTLKKLMRGLLFMLQTQLWVTCVVGDTTRFLPIHTMKPSSSNKYCSWETS